MCGICGYVSDKRIDDNTLIVMNDTMIHRGPNDSGIWQRQLEEYAIGMAQRRLSIFDLSELGHQPMERDNGDFVITYNGEVYNYIEIRDELEKLGYSFKSNCDTEVILAAYVQWKDECFKRFNGMFAIAIYDSKDHKIILARDRMGKKPLYYYKKGKDFVFSSELKPIMNYPNFEKEVDEDVIGMFLCNKCIQAPYSIFKNTYKLEPGKYLVYDINKNETHIRDYWNLVNIANSTQKSINNLDKAKRQLKELLIDSVEKRLAADVPVGTFLSGGIDSTLITALAQEVKDGNVDSYTIGFNDEERNEAPYAKDIAKHIGTNHHERYMSDEDILKMIDDLSNFYDEPFADSSQLPSMLVSKTASEDMTVVLSGDGGDELFCGYKMYDLNKIAQMSDWMGMVQHTLPWNRALESKYPNTLRAFINNRNWDYKTQLFIDVTIEEADRLLKHSCKNVKSDKEKDIKTHNHQERRMILDMVNYMPDDILTKMDRASMKYSLEVRCPIIDYRIVEWSFKVDHNLKYHGMDKKYLLKQLTYDYVPKELLDRPKKGFGVPLRKWLRTVMRPEILRFSDKDKLIKQGIFDADAIEELINKQSKSDYIVYSNLLWGFYVFQMWYNTYIEELF